MATWRWLASDSKVTVEEMEQGHPPVAAFEQYIKGLLAHAPASKISFLSQALRIGPAFQRVRLELWNGPCRPLRASAGSGYYSRCAAGHRLARQARFLGAVSSCVWGNSGRPLRR